MNLKNEVNTFTIKNKYLKKDFKEETKKWKEFSCSWFVRINTAKITILP